MFRGSNAVYRTPISFNISIGKSDTAKIDAAVISTYGKLY